MLDGFGDRLAANSRNDRDASSDFLCDDARGAGALFSTESKHLARMAVGRATRTLFGASEVVILRRENAAFEVTAARSYTPYVEALLEKISREVQLVG